MSELDPFDELGFPEEIDEHQRALMVAAVVEKATTPLPPHLIGSPDLATGATHEAALDYWRHAEPDVAYHMLEPGLWVACAQLDDMAKFVLCARRVDGGSVCIARKTYEMDTGHDWSGEAQELYYDAKTGELVAPDDKGACDDYGSGITLEQYGDIMDTVAGLTPENRIPRPPFTLYTGDKATV